MIGKESKPGTFLHDAPHVDSNNEEGWQGNLAVRQGHYFKVRVRKGQEIRAIAAINKAPYLTKYGQTFAVSIYDAHLQNVARQQLWIKGNPTTFGTLRARWKPTSDGIAYVGITASHIYYTSGSRADYKKNPPKRSQYKLTIKGAVESSPDNPIPVLDTKVGASFSHAGLINTPGMVKTDIKLGELAFYKVNVAEGERLLVCMAAQRPWFFAYYGGPPGVGIKVTQTTFTLTIYDDDQVQVAQKKFVVEKNSPDAQPLMLGWKVNLSGTAYVAVSCENTSGSALEKGDDPGPGHLVVQVTKPNGRSAEGTAFEGADAKNE